MPRALLLAALLAGALLAGCATPAEEAPPLDVERNATTTSPATSATPPVEGTSAPAEPAPSTPLRFELDHGAEETFSWRGETWRIRAEAAPRFTLTTPQGVAHAVELHGGERVVSLVLATGERSASEEPRNARVSFLGDGIAVHVRPDADPEAPDAWSAPRVRVEVLAAG